MFLLAASADKKCGCWIKTWSRIGLLLDGFWREWRRWKAGTPSFPTTPKSSPTDHVLISDDFFPLKIDVFGSISAFFHIFSHKIEQNENAWIVLGFWRVRRRWIAEVASFSTAPNSSKPEQYWCVSWPLLDFSYRIYTIFFTSRLQCRSIKIHTSINFPTLCEIGEPGLHCCIIIRWGLCCYKVDNLAFPRALLSSIILMFDMPLHDNRKMFVNRSYTSSILTILVSLRSWHRELFNDTKIIKNDNV